MLRLESSMWLSVRSLGDLDGVYPLALALAGQFPEPAEAVTSIHELIMNAVEHGNLRLGFEAKTQLLRQGIWHAEITRRLCLPEYVSREVEIQLMRDDTGTRLTIRDEGEGFAWREYVAREQSLERPNGRGLWIAWHGPFSQICFNEVGNAVTVYAAQPTVIPRILTENPMHF